MGDYATIIAVIALIGIGLFFIRNWATPADSSQFTNISAEELKQAMQAHPDAIILDVRTPQEYKGGHIKGALLMNYFARDFKQKVAQLDKEKPIYLYCRSGNRSSKAARLLAKMGHKGALYNLVGGYTAWKG